MTLLTGSSDKTARLWDVDAGKMLAELAHDGTVDLARFHPDGKVVLTAARGSTMARLWDAATGQPVAEPLTHDKEVLRRFQP